MKTNLGRKCKMSEKMLRIAGRNKYNLAKSIRVDDEGKLLVDSSPRVFPETLLKTELIETVLEGLGDTIYPNTIGIDGYVYCSTGYSTIARTNDGFGTMEQGYDFGKEENVPTHPSFVTKTSEGYVVVTSDVANRKAAIWFSTEFTTGFTKVADLDKGFVRGFNVSCHHPDYRPSVLLVGEYGPTNTPKDLYLSIDGGQSWKVVLTSKSEGYGHSHIHCSTYDPYRDRIWVSVGDTENSAMFYSDDLGESFTEIKMNEIQNPTGQRLQPTALIPLPDRIIFGADASPFAGMVMSIPIDTKQIYNNTETFTLKHEHTFTKGDSGLHYPDSYVVDGAEIYMKANSNDGSRKTYFFASGDGGESWYNVLVTNMSQLEPNASFTGVVGPDPNNDNCMYGSFTNGTTNRIVKYNKINWVK